MLGINLHDQETHYRINLPTDAGIYASFIFPHKNFLRREEEKGVFTG
jgi:hypothetical protein